MKERKYIDGVPYKLMVLKVIKRFPNGTPRVLERISEQGSTRIQGGEWFITTYTPEDNLNPEVVKDMFNNPPPSTRSSDGIPPID